MFQRSRGAIAAALLFSACAAQAVDILPDNGLWRIDAEANGKPGRGFQIDKQEGRVLVVTYFGYRADGSATFLQAVGEQDDSVFEADLVEFQGGTAIGGVQQDAQAGSTAGTVTLVFDSPTTGTLTLPGESPTRVSRFVYENHVDRFNAVSTPPNVRYFDLTFSLGTPVSAGSALLTGSAEMSAAGGRFSLKVTAPDEDELACEYTGTYGLAGSGIASAGTYTCPAAAENGTYRTESLVVDARGSLDGRIYRRPAGGTGESDPIYLGGVCMTGRVVFPVAGTSPGARCVYPEVQ